MTKQTDAMSRSAAVVATALMALNVWRAFAYTDPDQSMSLQAKVMSFSRPSACYEYAWRPVQKRPTAVDFSASCMPLLGALVCHRTDCCIYHARQGNCWLVSDISSIQMYAENLKEA